VIGSCEEVTVLDDLQYDTRLKYFRWDDGGRSHAREHAQPQIGPDWGHLQDPDQGLGLDPNRCLTDQDPMKGQGKEKPQQIVIQKEVVQKDQCQGLVL